MVIPEDKADAGHGWSRLEGAETAGRSSDEMIRDDPPGAAGDKQEVTNSWKIPRNIWENTLDSQAFSGVWFVVICILKRRQLQNPGELDCTQESSVLSPLMESHTVNGKYIYACFKGLFKSKGEGWCATPYCNNHWEKNFSFSEVKSSIADDAD